MGRHSGAICTACQRRIRVIGGKLIAHRHYFPDLGTSLPCVGSHSNAPQGWMASALPESTAGSDDELSAALIEDARQAKLDRPQLDAYLTAIQRTGGLGSAGDQ